MGLLSKLRSPPAPGATPQGPHLLIGLGEGEPHALVGGAAVPRWTGLAAEAGAGVDAADPGEAGMGVTLGGKGQWRVGALPQLPPALQ